MLRPANGNCPTLCVRGPNKNLGLTHDSDLAVTSPVVVELAENTAFLDPLQFFSQVTVIQFEFYTLLVFQQFSCEEHPVCRSRVQPTGGGRRRRRMVQLVYYPGQARVVEEEGEPRWSIREGFEDSVTTCRKGSYIFSVPLNVT